MDDPAFTLTDGTGYSDLRDLINNEVFCFLGDLVCPSRDDVVMPACKANQQATFVALPLALETTPAHVACLDHRAVLGLFLAVNPPVWHWSNKGSVCRPKQSRQESPDIIEQGSSASPFRDVIDGVLPDRLQSPARFQHPRFAFDRFRRKDDRQDFHLSSSFKCFILGNVLSLLE